MPELITSRDNQNIRLYSSLLTQKKQRDALGLFAAEGLRLCLDAAENSLKLHMLLITEDAAVRYPQVALLMQHAERCFYISEDLSRRIGDTQHPQGVFGVFHRPAQNAASEITAGNVLLVSDLQDPGNLGTILRTAQALGMDAAFLSGTADPYSPKVLRSSMGALFRFPVLEFENAQHMIAAVKQKQIPVYAAALSAKAARLGSFQMPLNGCGLLIGNEGNGLSDDLVQICDGALMIPMPGGANSLNAATAAAILMWEICRGNLRAADTALLDR